MTLASVQQARHWDDTSRVVRLLGRLGPMAEPAAEKLIECLGYSWTGDVVPESLARIGPAVIPHATLALRHERMRVRACAAAVLGRLGRQAAPAIEPLIDALHDSRMQVRVAAARSLGQIGPPASRALPALEAARQDSYQQVRQEAEKAIQMSQRHKASADRPFPAVACSNAAKGRCPGQ